MPGGQALLLLQPRVEFGLHDLEPVGDLAVALSLKQGELPQPVAANIARGRMILQELSQLLAALHGGFACGGPGLDRRLDARRHRIANRDQQVDR